MPSNNREAATDRALMLWTWHADPKIKPDMETQIAGYVAKLWGAGSEMPYVSLARPRGLRYFYPLPVTDPEAAHEIDTVKSIVNTRFRDEIAARRRERDAGA